MTTEWLWLFAGIASSSVFDLWYYRRLLEEAKDEARDEGTYTGRVQAIERFNNRLQASEIERERLRSRLKQFDTCRCGEQRKDHVDGLPIRCTGFRLQEPADDLETVIALAQDVTTVSDLAKLPMSSEADQRALADLARAAADQPGGTIAVEVGSWVGDSAKVIHKSMSEVSHCFMLYCVDTWQGSPSDSTGMVYAKKFGGEAIRAEFDRNMLGLDSVVAIHGRSVAAAANWSYGPIDFLYLDAEHTYAALKADIEAWLPRMSPTGTIVFHDYGGSFEGVKRAVDEAFPGVTHVEGTEIAYVRLWPDEDTVIEDTVIDASYVTDGELIE